MFSTFSLLPTPETVWRKKGTPVASWPTSEPYFCFPPRWCVLNFFPAADPRDGMTQEWHTCSQLTSIGALFLFLPGWYVLSTFSTFTLLPTPETVWHKNGTPVASWPTSEPYFCFPTGWYVLNTFSTFTVLPTPETVWHKKWHTCSQLTNIWALFLFFPGWYVLNAFLILPCCRPQRRYDTKMAHL